MQETGSSLRARSWMLIAFLALFAVLAAACGDDDDSTEASAEPTDASAEQDGATETEDEDEDVELDRSAELRWANSFGHSSFDPHRSPATSSDASFMRPVYDSLLTLQRGADGVEVGPQLATSYEIADDGLSISFELRDDVTFQDGTPFDAEAVKANIERGKAPDSTVASFLTTVDRVEVVDPTNVVFHLNQPNPGLPYSLAADTIGMMVSPAAFGTDLATEPVGSGPFTLVSAQRDAEVVFERWDEHWDPDAALVAAVRFQTMPDANARLNALRSGQLDAAYMASPLDLQTRDLVEEGFHWEQELAAINIGLMLNTTTAPFDDVDVRRAVAMAIDRTQISEELLGGIAPPVYQPFGEGYLGHDPALAVDPYDLEAAEQLITEAGAEGATVTLLTMSTSPYDSIAAIVQQALGEIGLQVEIEAVSPTVGIPTWREGGHQAFVGTILGEPEPSLTLARSYLAGDNVGEPPAELVEMAEEASTLSIDSEERTEAYQEISAYLVENPIHVPIVRFSTVVVARPHVHNSDELVKVVIGKLDFRGVGIAAE